MRGLPPLDDFTLVCTMLGILALHDSSSSKRYPLSVRCR